MWAVLASLYPAQQNPDRVSKYENYIDALNFTGMVFPMKIKDIPKFEKNNEISVNVFGYENAEIYPLKITEYRFLKHVNLLFLSNEKKQHYCSIKNLDRLLSHTNRHNGRYYFCNFCLHGFTAKKLLDDHKDYCSQHSPVKITLPDENEKWLSFKDYAKKLRVPYVVYSDFESLQCKFQTCATSDKLSTTHKTRKHIASGFTYKIVSAVPGENYPHVTYRGSNAAEVFIQHMLQVEEELLKRLKTNIPMVMSEEEEQLFDDTEECHICKQPLDSDRVRDHDHSNGQFRGAAHNSCNLNFKNRPWIPVFFHNLKG
jgi:hypothetical protein